MAAPVPPSAIDLIYPARDAFAITPSNTVNFTDGNSNPVLARAIYVGSGGDVVTVTANGTAVTHKNVPDGGRITGLLIMRVNATSTTASNMLGYI